MRTDSRDERAYRTQDLVTAAYLLCTGLEPKLRQVSERRVEFRFRSGPRLSEALDRYRRGEARLSPNAFHLCQLELRQRMDEVLEGRRGEGEQR